MTTYEIVQRLATTCEKCGQAQVATETHGEGQAWAMIPTGHLVCQSCFDAWHDRQRAPQGEQDRLFAPAPTQITGQMTL